MAGTKRRATTSIADTVAKRVWVGSLINDAIENLESNMPSMDSTIHQPIEVADEGETISQKEFMIREAWRGWEDSLRMALRQRKIGEAVVRINQPTNQKIHVPKMSKEEQDRLATWRTRYIGQPDNFEEEGMDGGTFRLDD